MAHLVRFAIEMIFDAIEYEVTLASLPPPGRVVRVSQGTFDPERFADIEGMTKATGNN